MMIPGPKNPGKKLDVFLRPLIDELKNLWFVGVETYDMIMMTWLGVMIIMSRTS